MDQNDEEAIEFVLSHLKKIKIPVSATLTVGGDAKRLNWVPPIEGERKREEGGRPVIYLATWALDIWIIKQFNYSWLVNTRG